MKKNSVIGILVCLIILLGVQTVWSASRNLCANKKAAEIDDKKICTLDKCDPATGRVTHVVACAAGAQCNAAGVCETADKCKNNPAVNDGKECTVDTCDSYTGAVWHAMKCGKGESCDVDGKCSPVCRQDYEYSEEALKVCKKEYNTLFSAGNKDKDVNHACVYKGNGDDFEGKDVCPGGKLKGVDNYFSYTCIKETLTGAFDSAPQIEFTCLEGYKAKGSVQVKGIGDMGTTPDSGQDDSEEILYTAIYTCYDQSFGNIPNNGQDHLKVYNAVCKNSSVSVEESLGRITLIDLHKEQQPDWLAKIVCCK